MLVSAYQLKNAVLRAGLSSAATLMMLDLENTSILSTLLAKNNKENFTYLSIQEGSSYEIVRVHYANTNAFLVDRGIDGTVARTFSAGAKVKFVLPTAAMNDITDEFATRDYIIEGKGIVDVQKVGPRHFIVNAPQPVLWSASDLIHIEYDSYYKAYIVYFDEIVNSCISYLSNPRT